MNATLTISRYRQTRNWAVWNSDELLAVTVYRKGAQAIVDFFTTNTPYTTMSKKQNKKTDKQVIILIENRETKQKHRALLGNKKTQICFETRGDWHTNRTHREPLTALIEQGIYKLANTRARQIYNEYFQIDAQQTTANMEEEEAQIWEQIAAENAEMIYEAEPEQEEEMEAEDNTMEGDNDCPPEDEPEEEDTPAEDEPQQAPAPIRTREAVCMVILPGETEPQPIPEDFEMMADMILIRKYKGETHRVEVINVGAYRYNGETYPTLTHISWKIAPYQISGNTFFGLPVKKRS